MVVIIRIIIIYSIDMTAVWHIRGDDSRVHWILLVHPSGRAHRNHLEREGNTSLKVIG